MKTRKELVFLVIALLLFPLLRISAQQTFTKVYAPSALMPMRTIVEAPSGGFMLVGETDNFGVNVTDHYLIRLNPDGTRAWSKTWGWGNAEGLEDIAPMGNGNWMAVGYTNNNTAGGSDVVIMGLDSLGDTLWTRVIGGPQPDVGVGLAQGADGNFGVIAHTSSFDLNPFPRVYFLRVSPTGQILNTQIFKGTADVVPTAIRATPDGGYLIGGYTNFGSFSLRDGFLLKIDSVGSHQWNKNYGFPWELFGNSIDVCANGDYLLAGRCRLTSQGPWRGYIIRTDSVGDTLWTRLMADADGLRINAIREAPSGDIWAFGTSFDNSSGGNGNDQILFRTDPAGLNAQGYKAVLPRWEFVFREGSLTLTSDGGVATVASTESYHWPDEDALIRKADSSGQSYCHEVFFQPTYLTPPQVYINSPTYSFASGGIQNTAQLTAITPVDTGFGPCESCPQPSADFSFQITGNTVFFSDSSQYRDLQTITWNFGDGTAMSGDPYPWKQYEVADSYLVCLTITDSCGTDSVCKWVNAPCPPPVVDFEIDTIVGNQVFFRNLSVQNFSTDLQMDWDYGDGGTLNTLLVNNLFHSYTYAIKGTYLVCLTGTDLCSTVTYCDSVTVAGTSTGWGESGEVLPLQIYPNPGDACFEIRLEPEEMAGQIQIEIWDGTGQVIKKLAPQPGEAVQINARGWASGLYLVRIRDENGRRYVGKWVKW